MQDRYVSLHVVTSACTSWTFPSASDDVSPSPGPSSLALLSRGSFPLSVDKRYSSAKFCSTDSSSLSSASLPVALASHFELPFYRIHIIRYFPSKQDFTSLLLWYISQLGWLVFCTLRCPSPVCLPCTRGALWLLSYTWVTRPAFPPSEHDTWLCPSPGYTCTCAEQEALVEKASWAPRHLPGGPGPVFSADIQVITSVRAAPPPARCSGTLVSQDVSPIQQKALEANKPQGSSWAGKYRKWHTGLLFPRTPLPSPAGSAQPDRPLPHSLWALARELRLLLTIEGQGQNPRVRRVAPSVLGPSAHIYGSRLVHVPSLAG